MALSLLLVLLVPLAVTLLVRASRWHAVQQSSGRLAAVARTGRRWRVAGLLSGVAVGTCSLQQGSLGRGLLLAAPLGALCVLLGTVVGELRVAAPDGQVRSAALEVRRVRDYVPRGLAVAVGAVVALLAGVFVLTTALGSPDDLGRAGRSLARICDASRSESRGPWPGSFYAVPLGAVVLIGLAVAAAALHRVVRRPRPGGSPHSDDALRRQAATAVLAAVGVLAAVPLAATSLAAAVGLLQICSPPAWWTAVGRVLLLLVPVAIGVGTWCAAVLLVPTPTSARVRA